MPPNPMKPSILIPAVMAFAFVSIPARAAEGAAKSPVNPQEFPSAEAAASAQAEAVKKYPQLGQTGSAFNLEFVSRGNYRRLM